jgi:anthranilate phosphoribosyltransferase
VGRCIDEVGIGFLFAPLLHPAMKQVAPVRKELGFRTVFNVLGPLTNPAFATHQLIGVFDAAYTETIASVGNELGLKRIFVVFNMEGLDELATVGTNRVSTVRNGRVETFFIEPEELGFSKSRVDDLKGAGAEENARITRAILKGKEGPGRDTVILNAALGLMAGESVETIDEGIELAAGAIDSGRALAKLETFIDFTNGFRDVS